MANFSIHHDYYLQAFRLVQSLTKGSNAEARRLLKEAINAAPDHNLPRAYGLMSFAIQTAWLSNWIDGSVIDALLASTTADLEAAGNAGKAPRAAFGAVKKGDPVDTIAQAAILSYAQVAWNLDDDDYDNRWSLGTAHLYNRHFPEAFSEYKEAKRLAKGRNTPTVCLCSLKVDYCDLLFFAGNDPNSGDPDDYKGAITRAITKVREAMADSPDDAKHFRWNWTLGWAYYELAAYAEADKNYALSLATLQQIKNPHHLIRKNLIASYVGAGMTEAAEILVGELMKDDPKYTLAVEDRWPYREDTGKKTVSRRERFKKHLRDAGLPD